MPPSRVFLSYSHVDERWKERLAGHLQVLGVEGLFEVWDDRRIAAGASWRQEIDAAVDQAQVAVLLISQDFLTSRFVRDVEVPRLLDRRARQGMRIVPVIVRSCPWRRVEWLAALQARPHDGRPLASFRGDRVNLELTAIAEEICDLLQGAPTTGSSAAAPAPAAAAPRSRPGARPAPGRRVRDSSAAAAEETATSPAARAWSWLRAVLRQRPEEATALLLASLGGGVGFLGLAAQRARERLIGIPPLSYPKPYLFRTGLEALWSLPWRGLATLAAPHPALRSSALTLLALTIGLLLVGRLASARPAVGVAALTVSAVLLSAGAWLYAAAIHSTLVPSAPGSGLGCVSEPAASPDRLAALAACTWLASDRPADESRRRGLAGLLGWLALAALAGTWAGARANGPTSRPPRARWGLAALHALTALLLLSLLPAAHAYGEWGVSYPAVIPRDQAAPACDQPLLRTISQRVCCAANVAAGAEGMALFLWGGGCPEHSGLVAAKDMAAIGASSCLVERPQMRPIGSRCP
jgi:hypothetical protein